MVDANLGWVMTTPFNMMSRDPVLTMPTGQAATGVPTSIQIVGRPYCDKDVFQVATAFIEAEFDQWFTTSATRPQI